MTVSSAEVNLVRTGDILTGRGSSIRPASSVNVSQAGYQKSLRRSQPGCDGARDQLSRSRVGVTIAAQPPCPVDFDPEIRDGALVENPRSQRVLQRILAP